ncbi:MAG: DUF4188 domain-containing protein, partial [Actinomycetota bacterium]|nr:DUF4188 domain-containing protein [Actinomycetota bacterium]
MPAPARACSTANWPCPAPTSGSAASSSQRAGAPRAPGARSWWRRFNELLRGTGDAGAWHETYRVRAGEYETIYADKPRVGLARAAEHVPVGSTST